ncbi:MAG: hypothetical protein WDN44_00535 [Sphingomonas sp.]
MTAALQADVVSAAKRKVVGTITFDALPKLGAPGAIVTRETVFPEPRIEKLVFANGVRLLVHSDSSETSKVYVNVRFAAGSTRCPRRGARRYGRGRRRWRRAGSGRSGRRSSTR